jgi:Protein of unknown function (DUF1236)
MRNTLRNALLVTTAAAGLATGITLAAAQGVGGERSGGGAMSGGASEHRQGPSGGGHAQSTQGPSGAQTQGGTREQLGGTRGERGHAQTERGTSQQLGGTREQRGHAFGEERNEGGKALGEQKGTKQLSQGRGESKERFGREDRGERFGTTRETGRTGFARERESRSVQLSSEQRTRIHDVFVRDRDRFNRFRVSRVEFDLRPGVRVPRSFHLFTIPSELVEVVPAYSGYLFFYYEDEIVIVDPVTWEIVAVIPA